MNLEKPTWIEIDVKNVISPREDPGVVQLGFTNIMIFGGVDDSKFLNDAYLLNGQAGTVKKMPKYQLP